MSGVLKFPTIIVLLLISPFILVSICLMYCGAPMLGAYIFIIDISSSWIDPLIIMQCPSLSLFTAFVLKYTLSDMSISTPAFFQFPFPWNIFSQPFTFSLYVSLVSRWASFRQQIQGSYFCIHSVSLCLLVGVFNPFTFKVIFDKYDPIAIQFIVLSLSLHILSVFPAQRRSFSICQRACLVVLYSLSFCLSVKLLISPSYLIESPCWIQ